MASIAESASDLSSDYPVSADQVRQFNEDGHILFRNVCSRETVAAFRPRILDAMGRTVKLPQQLQDETGDVYSRAFTQRINLWLKDEAVKQFVLARRFGQIAADLLGVDSVRLYRDQALVKEPGGGYTPWHYDDYYWPIDGNRAVTLWMPLVDISPEMGTMTFANGSHKERIFQGNKLSHDLEAYFNAQIAEHDFPLLDCGGMAAGDATFHVGGVLHKAPGNSTDTAREVMTVTYLADGTLVHAPQNDNQELDLTAYFPGRKDGEPADTELNPLVFRRGE